MLHKYDIYNVIFSIRLNREEKNEKNTTNSNECRLLEKAGKIVCDRYDVNGFIQLVSGYCYAAKQIKNSKGHFYNKYPLIKHCFYR